jgi:hypothetical protein
MVLRPWTIAVEWTGQNTERKCQGRGEGGGEDMEEWKGLEKVGGRRNEG